MNHIFNMSNPLAEDFVQVLANVFQVRTGAFVRKPVRVRATVVAELADGDLRQGYLSRFRGGRSERVIAC
jgi:hypothetical protein